MSFRSFIILYPPFSATLDPPLMGRYHQVLAAAFLWLPWADAVVPDPHCEWSSLGWKTSMSGPTQRGWTLRRCYCHWTFYHGIWDNQISYLKLHSMIICANLCTVSDQTLLHILDTTLSWGIVVNYIPLTRPRWVIHLLSRGHGIWYGWRHLVGNQTKIVM